MTKKQIKAVEKITAMQAKHGLTEMQRLITSGEVWKFEGSYGRSAMANLESGACYLPEVPTFNYYGNKVPSRTELKAGTKGTLENSIEFWDNVSNGNIELETEENDIEE